MIELLRHWFFPPFRAPFWCVTDPLAPSECGRNGLIASYAFCYLVSSGVLNVRASVFVSHNMLQFAAGGVKLYVFTLTHYQ